MIDKLQKYEKAVTDLRLERDNLEKRINEGIKIINEIKNAKKREEMECAKNKVDAKVWDSWLLKLLKSMNFEGIWYGDLVSIGSEGKRPFGSSSSDYGIPEILNWNTDEMPEKQINLLINALLEDLPRFLNSLIKKTEN